MELYGTSWASRPTGTGRSTGPASRRHPPLLIAFVLVCLLEAILGWLLWRRRRSGGILALALLPAEVMFWIGFALPFGAVLGMARTAFVIAGWSSLGAAASVASSPANR